MAASLRTGGYTVYTVPDAWSKTNALWNSPAPARGYLHIGLSGYFGQLEDITEIRRIVLRVMREFPNTRLVILDNPDFYHFFHHLDEDRRFFLPSLRAESRPALLKQIDLLLLPLRNHPYNRASSDRPLLEAGLRQIPWIATPIPAFTTWKDGGLTAETPEEWHAALRELLSNAELRAELGRAGEKHAQQRELQIVGRTWLTLLQETVEKHVKALVA
jgi:glycosyltransferase involved in cell wall biosynthesis